MKIFFFCLSFFLFSHLHADTFFSGEDWEAQPFSPLFKDEICELLEKKPSSVFTCDNADQWIEKSFLYSNHFNEGILVSPNKDLLGFFFNTKASRLFHGSYRELLEVHLLLNHSESLLQAIEDVLRNTYHLLSSPVYLIQDAFAGPCNFEIDTLSKKDHERCIQFTEAGEFIPKPRTHFEGLLFSLPVDEQELIEACEYLGFEKIPPIDPQSPIVELVWEKDAHDEL